MGWWWVQGQGRGRKRIPMEYKFYTEFQSHEPEFDCLKSLEIEEKINMIKWHKRHSHGALFLLATNGIPPLPLLLLS
jgi:serine/threonine-protein phosphatase 2A regulatory subunit B